MTRRILLYTRRGCGLCEEMLAEAQPVAERHGCRIEWVDIDQDPELARQYRLDIPLLELDGREIARHHLDADALEQTLAANPDT